LFVASLSQQMLGLSLGKATVSFLYPCFFSIGHSGYEWIKVRPIFLHLQIPYLLSANLPFFLLRYAPKYSQFPPIFRLYFVCFLISFSYLQYLTTVKRMSRFPPKHKINFLSSKYSKCVFYCFFLH
jgi:hypothetical protein